MHRRVGVPLLAAGCPLPSRRQDAATGQRVMNGFLRECDVSLAPIDSAIDLLAAVCFESGCVIQKAELADRVYSESRNAG